MIILSNMLDLKWLTLFVFFCFSLSLSTGSYQSAYEDSTSEIGFDYESTVDDLTTETAFDYGSTSTSESSVGYEDAATESTVDYEHTFTDFERENAFVPSDIKNLLYPPYDRDCPVHEHWEYCTGLCQRNCSNWSKALICPDICVQGCLCDWGFTRGPEGNCIPVSECPSIEDEEPVKINVQFKCKRNEHFSSCDGHEECQKNCSNYDKEISCDSTCQPGCICDEGFVRGRSGKCIPIEQCHNPLLPPSFKTKKPFPRFCRSNEHFSACNGLPMCQKSCSNYNESIICPLICVPGCVCDKGYVIGPDGECVPFEQCPFEMKSILTQDNFPVCPNNEHYSSCSVSPECQKSCSNMDSPTRCLSTCIEGCVCDDGYVRGPDRNCIPIEECTRLEQYIPIPLSWQEGCPPYSHYSYCNGHKQCQKTCSRSKIPPACEGLCFFGCICDDGFIKREVGGDCIREDQCPPPVASNSYQEAKKSQLTNRWNVIFGNTDDTSDEHIDTSLPVTEVSLSRYCPVNEHLSICNYNCQNTCSNYNKPKVCPLICVPGCVCDEGFARRGGNRGECIPVEQCPSQSEYNSLKEMKKSQSTNRWNLIFGNTNDDTDTSSTVTEDLEPFTVSAFNHGCPIEASCDRECKFAGHRYGICIGPRHEQCLCF